jgi:hypothetical protein
LFEASPRFELLERQRRYVLKKKTGIMHVRPTQAVTKETAEDRERIDCPHVCELCADVPALRPSFPTREGLRSHQSSAACCDRRSSFLGQTGFTDIVSPGGETVIDTTDPEWTVEKLVTCRGGGQVDGVQYERYWLVRWADWSVKPQGVEHAATQKHEKQLVRLQLLVESDVLFRHQCTDVRLAAEHLSGPVAFPGPLVSTKSMAKGQSSSPQFSVLIS